MESDTISTVSPSSSSPSASSCDALHFCMFCNKPFTKESSYNRHLSYCRRTQSHPRVRARSCRACNLAKTKCSFQPRCSRCVAKDLKCVYDGQKTTAKEDRRSVDVPAPVPSASSMNHILSNDLFALGDTQMQIDPATLGFLVNDVHAYDSNSAPPRPWESVLFENADNSLFFDSMDIAAMSDSQCLNTVPSSACTARGASFQALSAPASLGPQRNPPILARLRMSDPVSQHNTTLVIQALRAFPRMMLRRQTFPPFIHPHWHRPSTATKIALPEPLANCMSVAHIFASLTSETKPFLWRTIRAEQRRFIDEIDRFEKEEMFAAIQAHIIYLIMRVVDDMPQHPESDLQMLVSFQILCDRFGDICGEPFSRDEQAHPSSSWEDWISAESRRRVACLWFLIDRVVCVKIGTPCETTQHFRSLPLPGHKSLWEANTHSVWRLEYDTWGTMRNQGIGRFGDLIDAHKRAGELVDASRLDVWNAGADSLSILLNIATTMV